MPLPQPPPESNPILSAYESFYSSTPFITRFILSTVTLSYIITLFTQTPWLYIFFSNIPYITICKFQLFRLITSPLLCNRFLELIFAFLSFVRSGTTMEQAMGSTHFAILLLGLTILSNFAFDVIVFLKATVLGDTSMLGNMAIGMGGVWNLIFAMIAVECAPAHESSMRRVLFTSVPTRYYPLLLLGIFCLLENNIQFVLMTYGVSVAVGYAVGLGKLDFLTSISNGRRRMMENGVLRKFTRKDGWVAGPAGDTWDMNAALNEHVNGGGSGSGSGSGNSGAGGNNGWTPTIFRRGPETQDGAGGSAFQVSVGHRLGSTDGAAAATAAGGGSAGAGAGSMISSGITSVRNRSSTPRNDDSSRQGGSADRVAMLAAAERRAAAAAAKATNSENGDEEKGEA